jgi:hypothetical protein
VCVWDGCLGSTKLHYLCFGLSVVASDLANRTRSGDQGKMFFFKYQKNFRSEFVLRSRLNGKNASVSVVCFGNKLLT